jgi:hypothetical protein
MVIQNSHSMNISSTLTSTLCERPVIARLAERSEAWLITSRLHPAVSCGEMQSILFSHIFVHIVASQTMTWP